MIDAKINDNYMIYSKLLDGLNINLDYYKNICLLSLEGKNFLQNKSKIFVTDNVKKINMRKFDLILSIYGTFFFNPLYPSIQSIFRSLNVGGKFVFVLYPTIYDEKGNDILNSLTLIAESTYNDRIKRWKATLFNGLSNLFVKINENELSYNASFEEIKYIFSSPTIRNFLFDSETELDTFFKPIENNKYKRYSVFWNTISGIKI
jgi:SAM-dependent methyltransferase